MCFTHEIQGKFNQSMWSLLIVLQVCWYDMPRLTSAFTRSYPLHISSSPHTCWNPRSLILGVSLPILLTAWRGKPNSFPLHCIRFPPSSWTIKLYVLFVLLEDRHKYLLARHEHCDTLIWGGLERPPHPSILWRFFLRCNCRLLFNELIGIACPYVSQFSQGNHPLNIPR